MQIADLTVSNGLRTPPVASSPPQAASDFFRLFGEVIRGDVGAAQTSPPPADDSGVPSSGSAAPEAPADPSTGPVVSGVEPLRTGPSTPLRTGLQETMTVGGQSGDDRDATALDQSGTALALAFLAGAGAPLLTGPAPALSLDPAPAETVSPSGDGLLALRLAQARPGETKEGAGTVSTAAFERLAEGPRAALTPAGADAFDLTALSQFSEAAEEATPLASIRALADQHPLAAEPQGRVTHSSSLAVTLSAADAISPTPARLAEEPPRGPGEEGSVRLAPQGKPVLSAVEGLEATARPSEAAPLKPVLSAVEGAAPSVVPDAAAISYQRSAISDQLSAISYQRPALSSVEGPVLSGSTQLTTGLVEGSGRQATGADGKAQPSAATELLVQGPILGRIAGPVLSGSTPLTTGLVEGGPIAPRLATESAGLPMAASDETANSGPSTGLRTGEGATAPSTGLRTGITVSHDRPDGTAMEERPQPAAQPGALRDRLGVGQERLGSGSESEDGSLGASSPAPGSDHGHGSGPSAGEVSSTRADAPRPGASAVAERDRSLTLQVAQQIVAAARLGLREDGTSVRLRLRPESLGELLIKISWKEKGIVAAIQAESPVTARMLQENLGHLKAALGERGIAVNDLGVQVGVDLRHGRAHDDRLPETTTSGVVQHARPWLPRDEALPLASLIQREGLIDIRV